MAIKSCDEKIGEEQPPLKLYVCLVRHMFKTRLRIIPIGRA